MQITLPAIGLNSSHFFVVELDLFEGPIDLLLHLVKQNELPIEKLALAQVASQYSQCIERMRQFDLEVAGEYLVIAATLLAVKSGILLNQPVELVQDEEGNLINPHDELLRRLKEAEIYKEGAKLLAVRDYLDLDVFGGRGEKIHKSELPPIRYQPHDAYLLGKAFRKIIQNLGEQAPLLEITIGQVSIVERMTVILDTLREKNAKMTLEQLVGEQPTVSSIVGAFLALLELCKRQIIEVSQDEMFEEIYVSLRSESSTEIQPQLESEFDIAAFDDTAEESIANG